MKDISLHWLQGIFETVPKYPAAVKFLARRGLHFKWLFFIAASDIFHISVLDLQLSDLANIEILV